MVRSKAGGSNRDSNRDIIAYISPNTINMTGQKNPGVIAWWSAAFPGYGHMILGSYVIGVILIVHEGVINYLSGLNSAIFYSFIGDFNTAKQSLDIKWVMAYVPPYIFAIWDSYQRTIQLNEDDMLARQGNYKIITKGTSALNINRLDIKKPVVAVCWTFLGPGAGHIYINRLPILISVPWFVAVTYFANFLPAIHHTLVGNFEAARAVADPQWLLNLPSLYGFMAYDAYLHTLEYNNLYKLYQKDYLQRTYQDTDYQMPSSLRRDQMPDLFKRKKSTMYIVASFTLNKNLERALAELKHSGIQRKHILALPLDTQVNRQQYDSYKKTLFEAAPIAGTIVTLFGVIYGFVLEWGPVLWGLIGFGIGTGLGLIFDLYRTAKKKKGKREGTVTEIFILIHCQQDQTEKVKDILWRWMPLGVSTFD